MPKDKSETDNDQTPNSETESGTPKTLEEALALIDEQKETISSLNRESASRRVELKKLKDAEAQRAQADKERQSAEKSDLEKAQAKVVETTAALNTANEQLARLRKRQAFSASAKKLKLDFSTAQAEEDAFNLADLTGVTVEGDDIAGMDDALKALAKARPYLFAKPQQNPPGDINAGNGGRQTETSVGDIVARKRAEYAGAKL